MKKLRFSCGDLVKVVSWGFAEIRTPQFGVIVRVDVDDFEDADHLPYQILIEEDHRGNSDSWFFAEDDLEPAYIWELKSDSPIYGKAMSYIRDEDVNVEGDVVAPQDQFQVWLGEKIQFAATLELSTTKLIHAREVYELYLKSLK